MSVYDKLNQARVLFQTSNVKKSGKNTFANNGKGYNYFELDDILPVCNKICHDIKATCIVSFTPELATLEFVDTENPQDKICFTSPMSEANLKGSHPVQNLGAVETYIKRYLYQHCFEISESDSLDLTMNPYETQHNKLSREDANTLNAVLDIINTGALPVNYQQRATQIYENKDIAGATELLNWYKTHKESA